MLFISKAFVLNLTATLLFNELTLKCCLTVTIFVSMSMSGSIYVWVSVYFCLIDVIYFSLSFSFSIHESYNLIKTDMIRVPVKAKLLLMHTFLGNKLRKSKLSLVISVFQDVCVLLFWEKQIILAIFGLLFLKEWNIILLSHEQHFIRHYS